MLAAVVVNVRAHSTGVMRDSVLGAGLDSIHVKSSSTCVVAAAE